jgi:hypothetical protein
MEKNAEFRCGGDIMRLDMAREIPEKETIA